MEFKFGLLGMGNRMVTSQLQTVARWSQTDTGYDVRMGNSCEKDMFHQRAFFTVFACNLRCFRWENVPVSFVRLKAPEPRANTAQTL